MATRAERMQQRIRGAGHGQVEEVSFHLDLGGGDSTSEASPESTTKTPQPTRSTPNTSAKRKRLDTDPEPPSQLSAPPTAIRAPPTDGAALASASPRPSPATGAPGQEGDDPAPLSPEEHATPGSARSTASRRAGFAEEVGESPAKAPGTGQRRRVSGITSSSQKLQQVIDAVEAETDVDPLSSPLEQRTKRIRLSASQPSEGSARRPSPPTAEADDPDELSPGTTEKPRRSRSQVSPELTARGEIEREGSATRQVGEVATTHSELEEEPQTQSPPQRAPEDQAEEISPTDAAKRIGRKRPRRSPRNPSPAPATALASSSSPAGDSVEKVTEVENQQEQPAPKRRRTKAKPSPAKQRQGKPKPSAPPKSKRKKDAKANSKSSQDGTNEDDIFVNSQRFTKKRRVAEGEDASTDILCADIPNAKRTGVNCIDVLSTVCGDVIDTALEALEKSNSRAQDSAGRQEIRTKTKALEAYKRELEYRFLTHTIFVDHMYSLRQRVKSEQKQKAALREEIIRLRAEREHVAIRKDAVRIKHEKERDESLHQLGLSSAMHDIDLAIDHGRDAPELSPPDEKKAELANLELMIAKVADQSCTTSDTGGTLKQLRDFNGFLERAAIALEGR